MGQASTKVSDALLDLGIRLPLVGLGHIVNDGAMTKEFATL